MGRLSSKRPSRRGILGRPLLLFAVLLASIYEGMQQEMDPGPPVSGDGYEQVQELLPQFMPDAVKRWKHSDFIRSHLGEELQRIYTLTKEQEIEEFRARIIASSTRRYRATVIARSRSSPSTRRPSAAAPCGDRWRWCTDVVHVDVIVDSDVMASHNDSAQVAAAAAAAY